MNHKNIKLVLHKNNIGILKKLSLLFLALFLLAQMASAQKRRNAPNLDASEEETYASAFTYGVTTNTNSGLLGGIVLRHSKRLENELFGKRQYRYMALEIVNVKHPKEVAEPTGSGARFILGKQNYLFAIRPQYGREIVLSNRNADEGIAINAIVAVGASIGVVKPYFVQLQGRTGPTTTQAYNPATTQLNNILGPGSIFDGLGQSKLVPGLNLKLAFNFELSAFRASTTGLEIGFLAETFSEKIIIMALANNQTVFTSGYVTLFFGNKKQ